MSCESDTRAQAERIAKEEKKRQLAIDRTEKRRKRRELNALRRRKKREKVEKDRMERETREAKRREKEFKLRWEQNQDALSLEVERQELHMWSYQDKFRKEGEWRREPYGFRPFHIVPRWSRCRSEAHYRVVWEERGGKWTQRTGGTSTVTTLLEVQDT